MSTELHLIAKLEGMLVFALRELQEHSVTWEDLRCLVWQQLMGNFMSVIANSRLSFRVAMILLAK